MAAITAERMLARGIDSLNNANSGLIFALECVCLEPLDDAHAFGIGFIEIAQERCFT